MVIPYIISETKHHRAKQTKICAPWAMYLDYNYPKKANIAEILKQEVDFTWVASRKLGLIEQNRSGLYMTHTKVRYGRKAHTENHMAQTGIWVISRKRSLI